VSPETEQNVINSDFFNRKRGDVAPIATRLYDIRMKRVWAICVPFEKSDEFIVMPREQGSVVFDEMNSFVEDSTAVAISSLFHWVSRGMQVPVNCRRPFHGHSAE
jgi:hypothetical protein